MKVLKMESEEGISLHSETVQVQGPLLINAPHSRVLFDALEISLDSTTWNEQIAFSVPRSDLHMADTSVNGPLIEFHANIKDCAISSRCFTRFCLLND